MEISQWRLTLARLTHEAHQTFLSSNPSLGLRRGCGGAGSGQRAPSTGARSLTVLAPRRVRGAGTGACAPPGRLHCARARTPRGARLRRARRGGGRREGPDEGGERRGGRPRGRLLETGTRAEKRASWPSLRASAFPSAARRGPEEAGGAGARGGPGPGRWGRGGRRAGWRFGEGGAEALETPRPPVACSGRRVAGSRRPSWGGGGVGAAHGPGRGCLVSVSHRPFNFRMRYRQVCGAGRTLLRRPNLDRPGALGRASRAQ